MKTDRLFMFLYISIGIMLAKMVILIYSSWQKTQQSYYALPKDQWDCIEKTKKKVANNSKYAIGEHEIEVCVLYRKH
jgi:hypothetical protein